MADLSPSDIPRPGAARDPGVTARPLRVDDPTGAALQQFSRNMAAVSASFEAIGKARQEAEDSTFVDRYQLEYNKRAAALEAESLSGPESADPNFINIFDSKLEKAQQETLDDLLREGRYSPSEAGRKSAVRSALGVRTSAARRAAVAANNQRVLSLYDTAQGNATEVAKIAAGNGDLDGALARVDATADSLGNVLPPDKLRAWKEAARATVVEMTVLGHLERNEVEQAKGIVNRYTGFAGEGADDIKRTIIAEAEAEGVDPAVALAIAGIESRFDPNAKNPNSTAGGLFQFVSKTGGQYGLPADARQASVAQQARAGAQLTAANADTLRRGLGAEPTPGELYMAHFLGAGDALRVLKADPEARADEILAAKVIAANPFLKNWDAQQVITWADGKMQGQMEGIAAGKVLEGRDVKTNQASIPIDAAVKLNNAVNAKIKALEAEQEKRQKRLFDMMDPTKPRKSRDPARYVAEQSAEAAQAYTDALAVEQDASSSLEDQRRAWERAGDTVLQEQAALGVQPHATKVLTNTMAQAIVQQVTALPGDQAAQQFLSYRERFGRHWNRVFGELAEQGLPTSYQMLGVVEDNPVQVDLVSQTLNVEEKDLKKDLGSTVVASDITDPLEDRMADFVGAFESGPFGTADKMQSAAVMETLRKVALVHYRQFRDAGKAVEAAAALIESRYNVVETSSVRAIVPVEAQLSDGEVERAAYIKQTREMIEGFDPVSIGSGTRASVAQAGQAARFAPLPPGLSEGERSLIEYHRNNLRQGTFLDDAEGLTTVYVTGITGPDGRVYNVPGFFDGKRQSPEAAAARAASIGWDKFPSYATGEESNRAAEKLHATIEADGEAFRQAQRTSGAPDFLLRERTIRTAANSGIWVTNETGDGIMLTVPFGVETATVPLLNANGDRYEIKYDDVRRLIRETPPFKTGIPGPVSGPAFGLTPEEARTQLARQRGERQKAEAP